MASSNPEFDSRGRPIIDPTKNVLDLVEASVKRLDDLRAAEKLRIDEIRTLESTRIDQIMSLHEEYREKLTQAEAKRIDAIRAVDVGAVAIASERAAAQATVLANQLIQTSDTLRSLVAQNASSITSQIDAMTKVFNERITSIEKAQYETKGKTGVTDPMQEVLNRKMDSLIETRALTSGSSKGMKDMWGWVIGALMAGIALANFIIPRLI